MLTATKIDIWSATIEDRPGGLKEKLEALAIAGADLEFLIARRLHEMPGKGVVFLTPLKNEKEVKAGEKAGFHKSQHVFSVRVQGPDEPGMAYRVTSALTEEGINVRGISAGRVNEQLVMYLAFDSDRDADRASERLNRVV